MREVAVIIPAYNEAARLGQVLTQLSQYPYDVIVVDDGSTDQTAHIASQAGVIVLRHVINRGQGAALETGMEYCRRRNYAYVVHFDADGQMQPAEIEQLLTILRQQPEIDIVLGTRAGRSQSIPWAKRYLLQKPALWFQRWTTGLALTDVHNGFRAMRGSTVRRLRLKQNGMAHAHEIVRQIQILKLRYQETPVTITYHEFGQGFIGGLKIFRDLLIRKILK